MPAPRFSATVDVLSGGKYGFSLHFRRRNAECVNRRDRRTISFISGGNLNVAGTITSHVAVFSGGIETVSSGGVVTGAADDSTVIFGGEVDVLSGGKLGFATVFSGGALSLAGGGSAANIIVSGGNLDVAGTTTSNVRVLSGGTETISSGGVASGVAGSGTSVAGGELDVQGGGTVGFASVSLRRRVESVLRWHGA